MAEVGRVNVALTGNAARLNAALGSVTGRMRSVAATATKMAAVASAAFAAIGVAAVAAADTVQKGVRNIQIGTGATGKALQKLKFDFKAVFKGVPQSAGEVSSVIASLNTLFGVTGGTLRELSKRLLDVSRLTGGDARANSLNFGRALRQWQVEAGKAPLVLDKLFFTTQKTGIAFSEIISVLKEYSAVLINADFTMDESIDLFGRLSSVGISVSRVMPGLNAAFRRWAEENLNAKDQLTKIITEMKSASTTAQALNIATEAFGAEGAQRLLVAVQTGTFALEGLGKGLDKASGALDTSREDTETLGESFSILKNRVILAIEPIGRVIIEMFTRVEPFITRFIENFAKNLPQAMLAAFDRLTAAIPGFGAAIIRTFNSAVAKIKNVVSLIIGLITKLGEFIAKGLEKIPFGPSDAAIADFRANLAGIQGVADAIKESIKGNEEAIAGAEETAQGWANTVKGLRGIFTKITEETKAEEEAQKAVNAQTAQANTNAENLTAETGRFIGTIEVAGRSIGVNINSQLQQSLNLIRQIAAEARAAAAAGGT